MEIFHAVNLRLAVSLVLVSFLWIFVGIMASHRIAGPVFRMKRYLDSVADGNYSERLTLRKKDELKDLADAINRLVDKLGKRK